MMKKAIVALFTLALSLNVMAGDDITDVVKMLRKNKVEAALKSRQKIKITTSPDQFLYNLSECLLYNSPKYAQYNPIKAYEFYKKIVYSDYVTNKRVLDTFREGGFNMETVRSEVEKNLMNYASEKGTLQAYDQIIEICESCSYLDAAKKAKEDIVFNKALKGASLKDVEQFIADYPKSANIKRATEMRDSIVYAQLPKTADAYAMYVERYPNSKFVPVIKKDLQKMSREEAKQLGTINSYSKYIANYPDDTKTIAEFKKEIEKLQETLVWKIDAKYKNIRLVKDTVKNKSYYLVNDYGKWGICDFSGKTLVTPSFDDFSDLCSGKLIAKKGGKWGMINPDNGNTIFDFLCSSASDLVVINQNFIGYKMNGMWGASYLGQKTAIDPFISGSLSDYKYKSLVNGGLAMTEAGRLVIAGPDGTVKCDEKFDQVQWRAAGDIDSKFIKVRKGSKYGLYGPDGEKMTEIIHDMLPYFDLDGIAIIKTSPIMEGWMDTTGAYLYHGQLSEYQDCGSDAKMIAYKTGGKFGFLDKTAVRANIKPQYDAIVKCFNHGLAIVKKDGKCIVINKQGNEIVSVPEANVNSLIQNGDIILFKNGGSYDVYNTSGKVASISGYDEVYDESSNGMTIVKRGGKYGALKGYTEAVAPKYDNMTKYCNGYSIVKLNGKFGLLYYDKEVIEPKCERLLDPSHFTDADCESLVSGKTSDVIYVNTFVGGENTKYVIKAGKIIMKTADEIRLRKFDNLYTAVETAEMGLFNNAKTALVSPTGVLLVNPSYKSITALGKEYFICKTADDRCGILDKNGKVVVSPFAQSIKSFDGKVVIGELNGDMLCFDKYGVSYLPKDSDLGEDGVFKNKKNNKYGLVDAKGNIQLDTQYNKISGVSNRSAIVIFNDKYGVVKY